MGKYGSILKNLAWLTQLGFSILTPPVLMILLGSWLQDRFGLGVWVMLLAIFLGLGASCSSALHFYKVVRRQTDAKQKTDAFNSHD